MLTIFVVALLTVLVVPASAVAQRCTGEDVAAIDQYCELLPTAEGMAPSDEPRGALRSVLPAADRTRLWRAGPTGRALLAIAPGAPMRGDASTVEPLPGAAGALAGRLGERDDSRSTVRAIGSAAWDGGRLSELFRWLLLSATVGLVGTAWVRRSR